MNALGNYLLRGKLQGIAVLSLMAILSLLLPPLSYIISGAPVGLVTLRKGGRWGFQVLFGSMLLVAVFSYFTPIGMASGAVFALGVWLPVWLCALVLRATESQGMVLLTAAGMGLVLILGMYMNNDDLTVTWKEWVRLFLENNIPAQEIDQMQVLFEKTLPLLTGILASGVIISLVLTVFMARWWQSRLYNPGGFREEFHRLLLPRWLTILTSICLLISVVDPGAGQSLIRNVLILLVVIHMFQGIASVHRTVAVRKLSRIWLMTLYFFLVLLPQMALFLACIGMADTWVRHRKSPPSDTDQV